MSVVTRSQARDNASRAFAEGVAESVLLPQEEEEDMQEEGMEEEQDDTPITSQSLHAYASSMMEYINTMKEDVKKLEDVQISVLIEQNKVCKAMFQKVFVILVAEQVTRMNKDSINNIMVKENKDEEVDISAASRSMLV